MGRDDSNQRSDGSGEFREHTAIEL